MPSHSRVAIIGAGISGLALARALAELQVPATLYEAADRPGGVIDTVFLDSGHQLNYGANTLFVDEDSMAFLQRAGLGPHWVEPRPISKARFVLRGDTYRQLPGGPLSLLTSGYFSWGTKRALLRELRLKPGQAGLSPEGESVATFFVRHFGPEVVELAVQPFVAGIYAADARELLVALAFPQLVAMEREQGSLLRGLAQQARKAGKGGRRRSISFVLGMQEMCYALAQMSDDVRLSSPVQALERTADGWAVHLPGQAADVYTDVVITIPTTPAARLLDDHYPRLSKALLEVQYAEVAQVHLAYKAADLGIPLAGFGGLHPPSAGLFTSGVLWISSVLPMRCPPDEVLLVAFCGGQGRAPISNLSDEQIGQAAEAEVRRLYRITGQPTLIHTRRWPKAIPLYDKHLAGLSDLAATTTPDHLHLLGNYLQGVSVSDCIKNARALALALSPNNL